MESRSCGASLWVSPFGADFQALIEERTRCRSPRKTPCLLASRPSEPLAQTIVGVQCAQVAGKPRNIVHTTAQRGIAADLDQSRLLADDHRTIAGHGLQRRQAKTLVTGGKDQREGVFIKRA